LGGNELKYDTLQAVRAILRYKTILPPGVYDWQVKLLDNSVWQSGFPDEVFLRFFAAHIAACLEKIDPDDGECDMVMYTRPDRGGQYIPACALKEFQDCLVFKGWWLDRSTTTFVLVKAAASPSPVKASMPVLGEAAMT
jgi:hypothetical protein